MPSLGPMEILVIFVVALLVLGPKRLPDAGRQMGRALSEFRRWSTGVQQDLREAFEPEPQPPAATPVTADRTPPATPTPVDLQGADPPAAPPPIKPLPPTGPEAG